MVDIDNLYQTGKIEIKFQIVNSTIGQKWFRYAQHIYGLFLFGLFFLFIPIDRFPQPVKGTLIFFAIVCFIIFHFIFKRLFLRLKNSGVVTFNSKKLDIHNSNSAISTSIPYSNIKKIKYRGNVPETYFTKYLAFKSYKVEFIDFNNQSIILELSAKNMLSEKDKSFLFSYHKNEYWNYLDLITILKSIKPKLGVERSRKLKYHFNA